MIGQTVSFFLPTRKGSERVINKNTRPFAGIEGGLVENKIRQLLSARLIDEIVFSSNDELSISVAEKFKYDSRLKIIERPSELCLSSTNLQDLISYVPTVTQADHILWGHVTTPFADADVYDSAIKAYEENLQCGYDSLVGVTELRNFLLNKDGTLINNTTDIPWPRTQDLEPIYEINHTVFLASRRIYREQKNRLGHKPFLHVMDSVHSLDIDWPEDFTIAEAVYRRLYAERPE